MVTPTQNTETVVAGIGSSTSDNHNAASNNGMISAKCSPSQNGRKRSRDELENSANSSEHELFKEQFITSLKKMSETLPVISFECKNKKFPCPYPKCKKSTNASSIQKVLNHFFAKHIGKLNCSTTSQT